MSTMKPLVFAIALEAITAYGEAVLEPQQVASSHYPDSEAATNIVFDAGTVNDNKWSLVFEIDATVANNAQIEFGIDADGDGMLGLQERELIVGWDCGEWFVRDMRGGTSRRAEEAAGRNRLEWTLYLKHDNTGNVLAGNVFSGGHVSTWFNPAWDMVRIAVRGNDAANERIASKISAEALVVRIR